MVGIHTEAELAGRLQMHWYTAESLVGHRLEASGFPVSIPAVPISYDLVADTPQGFKRIQVRRANYHAAKKKPQGWGDRAGYTVSTWHRRRSLDGSVKKTRATPEEYDYLAVVCEPALIYLIPSRDLLASRNDVDELVLSFRIKPIETAGPRMDSREAAERWEPYRNNFEQLAVVTK